MLLLFKLLFKELNNLLALLFLAILIERSVEFIKLSFSDGVKVKWSLDSLKVFVNVEEKYRGKVAGLCGDFNSMQTNDLVMRDFKTYATDLYQFGNNWKTDSSVRF